MYFCSKQQISLESTQDAFDRLITGCREIFIKKTMDYGTSWRWLRPTSITDQIFIKAWRLRTIYLNKVNKVGDAPVDEYTGMINYCIIDLIQLQLPKQYAYDIPFNDVMSLYDKMVTTTRELLAKKNHDYGEVWKEMRLESILDIILVKIRRIKQIEDADGKTLISEGIDSNLFDIINYCIFSLILLNK